MMTNARPSARRLNHETPIFQNASKGALGRFLPPGPGTHLHPASSALLEGLKLVFLER